ncbi:AAA family ATPase [Octadecabacter antarcticus]|uniref:AAA family ATPase n=1 Tax=Octadecabacter antarcticus TaxID=1217908 RepID=UPI00018060FE|nr:AAA family ATPase [Octadecabacter antarcticus]
MDALAEEVVYRNIDVLVIDPFVLSHRAGENDNNAVEIIAKECARLADRCNCVIELVHYMRKTNCAEVLGMDATIDRKRITRIIEDWLQSGALVKGEAYGPQRRKVPGLEVAEWATQ